VENDCSWIRALPVPPNEGEKPVSHGVPQDRLRSEDLSERWETGFSYLVLRTGIEPVSHIPEFLIRCIMQEDRQRECILCCIYLHKPLIFFNQHPDTGNPKSVILVIGFR